MVYQPNIPQPTDQISQSQDDILGNFQALNPFILGVIDLPPQSMNPASTTHNIIYAKIYTGTSKQEVFIENSAGTTFIPITAAITTTFGWTYLPSGLLMTWGRISGTGTAVYAYSGTTNFPGFTMLPLSISLTPYRTTATPTFQVYIDAFSGSPNNNTNMQLSAYFTSAGNAFFLSIGI